MMIDGLFRITVCAAALRLFLLAVTLLTTAPVLAAEQVRMTFIPTDPALRPAADLVATRLSGQNNLGHFYQQRCGVPRDLIEGVHWYRKSVEHGEAYGESNLSWMYQKGPGVEENSTQAEYRCGSAAEQGFDIAQYNLAWMTLREGVSGDAVLSNNQEAAEWFQRAANQRHVKAMLELGKRYLIGHLPRNYPAAIDWFEKAAARGEMDAIRRLGEIYFRNFLDRPADCSRAIHWWKLGAAHGDAEMEFMLGCALMDGKGAKADPSEARRWLKKVFNHGFSESTIRLAKLDGNSGDGAIHFEDWERLQASTCHPTGLDFRLQLAIAYEEGLGGPIDSIRAAKTYHKVINQWGPHEQMEQARRRMIKMYADGSARFTKGSNFIPESQEDLSSWLYGMTGRIKPPETQTFPGNMFLEGKIVPQDTAKAVEWFKLGSRNGNAEAMRPIGRLWARGGGGVADPEEAVRWNRQASTRNNSRAQFELGSAYLAGPGTTSDRVRAWRWLKLSANQGDVDAKTLLSDLVSKLTPDHIEVLRALAPQDASGGTRSKLTLL